MSARRWHGRHQPPVRPAIIRLLTLGRPLRTRTCPLCACLVAVEGAAQHERHHQAGGTPS